MRQEQASRKVGPALLWFATLGGAVAWSLHLLVAWELVEVLGCAPATRRQGTILGLSLSAMIALVTAGFCVVAAASGLLAYRFWRRLTVAGGDLEAEPRTGRAAFMALLGLLGSVLFVLSIVFAGVALAFVGSCRT